MIRMMRAHVVSYSHENERGVGAIFQSCSNHESFWQTKQEEGAFMKFWGKEIGTPRIHKPQFWDPSYRIFKLKAVSKPHSQPFPLILANLAFIGLVCRTDF